MPGLSGCVSRGSSCLLTRVPLCSTNFSPCSISTWDSGADLAGLASTDLESAQEAQMPILFLLLLPENTREHMHAHMHICTDVEPPSAPAASCLASPCLPPSPLNPTLDPLFCLCSHSDPQLQPQPAPPPSWDCCFISPWVNRGSPCAVGLVSMPPSVVGSQQAPPPPPSQLRGRFLPSSHASSSFFTGISCWTHT